MKQTLPRRPSRAQYCMAMDEDVKIVSLFLCLEFAVQRVLIHFQMSRCLINEEFMGLKWTSCWTDHRAAVATIYWMMVIGARGYYTSGPGPALYAVVSIALLSSTLSCCSIASPRPVLEDPMEVHHYVAGQHRHHWHIKRYKSSSAIIVSQSHYRRRSAAPETLAATVEEIQCDRKQ